MLFNDLRYIRLVCHTLKHKAQCLLKVGRDNWPYCFDFITRVGVEAKKRIARFDARNGFALHWKPLNVPGHVRWSVIQIRCANINEG